MYCEKIMNVSVKAVHDKRLIRTGDVSPVRIRVIHNRIAKYYNTGKDLNVEDWGKLISSKNPKLIEIKSAIKQTFDFVLRNVEDLLYNDYFSLDNLSIRLGRISAGSINSLLDSKIQTLKKEGRIGSMNYYKDVLASIHKYSKCDLPLEAITIEWLKQYEKYLHNRGVSYATIAMRMRGVRTIINEAIVRGLLKKSQYPFGLKRYEIKEYRSEPKALSVEQVRAIVLHRTENDNMAMYKDLWLFILFCNGINPADLVNLRYSNIIDGEINFIREKTKLTSRNIKHIRVSITSEMQDIIDRWGNKPMPGNYIFPLIHHSGNPTKHKSQVGDFVKKVNETMNQIGAELGFGRITTYVARHSFATILKQNGVNLLYIAEALGHTDIKSTSAYLDSFRKEERIKNSEILTRALSAK